jgi:hypothetical protein
VKALARDHIAELDRKMAEMAAMKAALEQIAVDCKGDDGSDCEILSKLSGGAAGQKRAAPPKAATKAPKTAQLEWRDASELTAWMYGPRHDGKAAQI